MRILGIVSLLFLLGNTLLAQSYCDKAKQFLATYRANVNYYTTKIYKNPVLQYLQRSFVTQVRNLESSFDHPELYQLNCQRLLEQVRTRILQLQAAKDAVPAGKIIIHDEI